MEEDLDFFFNNNASQAKKKKKKKVQDEKNQTLQHNQDKIEEFSNEHFVGWGEGRRFI